MAQSGPAPAVHPRRQRPDSHQIESNNGPGGPPIIPTRFSETDWEARDVSGAMITRPFIHPFIYTTYIFVVSNDNHWIHKYLYSLNSRNGNANWRRLEPAHRKWKKR